MARIDSDVYLTPPEVVADFLGRCPLPDGLWCEPAVGSGSIVRATNEERNLHHDRVLWTTCDVRPRPSGIPADVDFVRLDFVGLPLEEIPQGLWGCDVYITNPPFTVAEAYARRCFALGGPGSTVALLLRVSMLESFERIEFWKEHTGADLYPIVPRVDFTGGGGDSCAYGWFVWGPSSSGRIHHAATPWRAPKERKRKAVASA